jgi:putative aldouronate transport system substrate-binding protein
MKRFLILGFLFMGFCLMANGSKEVTNESKSATNFNETGLPIVNEKITLSAIVLKDIKHSNYDDMPIIQNLEKETNIKIDWIEIPQSNFEEKKNLIMGE